MATSCFMSPVRGVQIAVAATFFAGLPIHATPEGATLRDQLKLATADDDTLARIELLRRILDVEPGDAKSHEQLIALWLKIRDYNMAETALKAWSAAPANITALTTAEVLRNRDQDLKGAITVLNDYLAKSPTDKKAWEALVDCLLAAKDNPALLKALDAYIALDPSPLNAIRRANAKLALGDFNGALADAKAAQKAYPDEDVVKNAMPQYERLAEALQALPPLDAAIAKNPNDAQALLDHAWWWRYGGVNDRSLADAEAALKIAPASTMALITKYRALYLLDEVKSWEVRDQTKIDVSKSLALDTAQYILACDLALAKKPDDAVQLGKRAYALNEAEQYALALQDVDKALILDPKAAEAALEGIFALATQNSDPAAYLRKLEQADPTKPQLAMAYGYMAEMYFRMSNLALALDFADRSLAEKETERFLRVKASTLQRLDRGAEAAAALKRADALQKKQK